MGCCSCWSWRLAVQGGFGEGATLQPSEGSGQCFQGADHGAGADWKKPSHVRYLDTVVLLGSISAQYPGHRRFAFGVAACGSFSFFTALGYGARLLFPVFAKHASMGGAGDRGGGDDVGGALQAALCA